MKKRALGGGGWAGRSRKGPVNCNIGGSCPAFKRVAGWCSQLVCVISGGHGGYTSPLSGEARLGRAVFELFLPVC